jgi:hypothetical protein
MTRSTGGSHTVRQVDYTYYGSDDPFGTSGDLKTATVSDGTNTLDRFYYRYYSQCTAGSLTRAMAAGLRPSR